MSNEVVSPQQLYGDVFCKWYEQGLKNIVRYRGFPLNHDASENVLDHTDGMREEIKEFCGKYTNLASELNKQDLEILAYFHDGGEIYSDDMPHHGPDYTPESKIEHKKREYVSMILICGQITDKQAASAALGYFIRYMEPKPDDKESLFVHVIDKIQSLRFIKKYGDLKDVNIETIVNAIVQANILRQALKNEASKQELDYIVSTELAFILN